ncbi:MAG: methylenetetrahydrofolate reductase [NAD(P)H] [Chitinophagales bacterium]
MKVIEQFNQTDKALISFEILPPLKGKSIQSMYRILDLLMEFQPPFINVTYHRAEYKFKLLENGLYEKVYTRKRPGTVGICAAIQYKYGVDAVPHLVCGGFNKNETEDALVDLNYLGVNNVLLLRGDAVKGERSFMPETNGNKNAVELVEQVVNMNNGIYLEEDLRNPVKTDFCIGVAGYPEKHQEAPNTASDLKYLKQKIDAGADYIVTQMFFDNQKYFDFVRNCRAVGINVPIIPGLKPITSQSQVDRLPGIFNISLPEDLVTEIQKYDDREKVREIGIEWTVQQCRELLDFGVPCLHFYTMSEAGPFQKIMKTLI